MKDRFVMRFSGTMTTFAEDDLNNFLDANPEYRLVCMTYAHQSSFYYGIIAYFERINNNSAVINAPSSSGSTTNTTNTTNTSTTTDKPSHLITCPKCKTTQRRDRVKCWECGYEFTEKDKKK